ncbi:MULTISPECIES: sodium:proton antiporter NhaD [unclassified Moraxella]|uniref:sodium:proton antiporter NhaD n=1 Tax=unclassified Moraxella TaxID=2685852 RepID=UPI003AF90652
MSWYVMIALVFVVGYLAIAFEHQIHVNKAASALLTAIVLWVLLTFGIDQLGVHGLATGHGEGVHFVGEQLREHLAEIAEILFFLMGAMTIVELVDAHDGFRVITDRITTQNATKLLWIITLLTFFLSALLDNLTTTIVMVSLVSKLIADQKMRWYFAGLIVISANAGGAWSPVGDVTTTMLWIGEQITATGIILNVFLPSIVCTLVPLVLVSMQLKGQTVTTPSLMQSMATSEREDLALPLAERIDQLRATVKATAQQEISSRKRITVLALGLGALAFVPIFKTLTHLPPYIGVLFGVAVLWMVTELMHRHQDDYIRERIGVEGVLSRIDMPSILFFLGILLAVSALATGGVLNDVAHWLDSRFGNVYVINVVIGLLSSIVDNVPLVAGAMNMYPLATDASIAQATATEVTRLEFFRQNGLFWEFLAYCAGTGGSCLIIGSAAGVAAMGMEKIPFMWYVKRITWLALSGYLAGAGVYVLVEIFVAS